MLPMGPGQFTFTKLKIKINAVRREGVDQFTGLPLWTD
jgi:hypothetical protein